MSWLTANARALLAAAVFVGIVLPDLARWCNPFITPAVICTLAAALLRLNWQALWRQARRPRLPALLCIWQLAASPLLIWGLVSLFDLPSTLGLALILQASAPPLGSAPVFALLLGMDASLTLVATVASTLLLPISLTPLVGALPDSAISIDLASFFLRVSLMVGAPFVLAFGLRKALGRAWLARNDDALGAINLLLLAVFAIGVMDGVTAQLVSEPWAITRLFAAACAMSAALHIAGYLVFARSGQPAALTAAICSGNRNMGLMLAITAGSAGADFALYVGVAQIPMYLAPLLVSAWLRWRRAGDKSEGAGR